MLLGGDKYGGFDANMITRIALHTLVLQLLMDSRSDSLDVSHRALEFFGLFTIGKTYASTIRNKSREVGIKTIQQHTDENGFSARFQSVLRT